MCEYCENGKNIELSSDSAKSYWFIIHRNGKAVLYCKMGESEFGNAYGIEISHCPMCGRDLTEREVNPQEFTEEELWEALAKPDLTIETQSGHRYGAKIMSVDGTAENCEMKIKVNFTEVSA